MTQTVEFTKEDGKIVGIKVNGKDVKKASLNAFKKAQTGSYFHNFSGNFVFQNPYSGVEVELTPLEFMIYHFCNQWYSRYTYGGETEFPVSVYDNMKYFLLELNSRAYMDLLD